MKWLKWLKWRKRVWDISDTWGLWSQPLICFGWVEATSKLAGSLGFSDICKRFGTRVCHRLNAHKEGELVWNISCQHDHFQSLAAAAPCNLRTIEMRNSVGLGWESTQQDPSMTCVQHLIARLSQKTSIQTKRCGWAAQKWAKQSLEEWESLPRHAMTISLQCFPRFDNCR